jgi:hypothetical protein
MATKTSTELHMVSCVVYGWPKSPDTQAQARMIIKRKVVITGNLWRGCESLPAGKILPNCTIVVKHASVMEKQITKEIMQQIIENRRECTLKLYD